MTVLVENDLRITLPAGVTWRKFDDETSHGLSHCMKAMDFIVELEDRILFIEFKDPDHSEAQAKDRGAFIDKFLGGALDADLKTKYRDSWLYQWAERRITKPIYYLVLIGAVSLSAADLLTRTDSLKRHIPLAGPGSRSWKQPFVAGCAVMNLASWNKALPLLPVSRVGP